MNLFPDNAIASELAENGKGLIGKIKTDFPYVNAQDKAYFQHLGINESNVYLHIKGHTIYTLIKSIGNCLCYRSRIDFEKDILLIYRPWGIGKWTKYERIFWHFLDAAIIA